MTPTRAGCAAALIAAALAGCTHNVKVDPIRVEPIDITLRIYLEADRKLESFFDYQEDPAQEPPAAAPNAGEGTPS